MADELLVLQDKPPSRYMIAGWKPQWSDGGEISSGLPRYLIDKVGARKIGEMSDTVSMMCYPFQVPGTHDAFRPAASFAEGLPTTGIVRDNQFYYAGDGLVIFLGEEPWFRIDLYTQAFFQAVRELGIQRTVAVEGYNGPAPPELERSVNCSYSKADMKEELEGLGVRFSSYGSDRRSGPTIAMALITLAHYNYPDIEMFRLGSMAPMYSFLTANKEPVGITRDHRSFYDIMRRLRTTFKLDIDLGDLKQKGDEESGRLQAMLERVASSNANAKEIIEKAREEFNYTPFVEPVELTPSLDKALDDILRNAPDQPDEE
ncbi:MAG: PAC2 family protein [Dehalococcoidia bacterium]|nr:PAC2 family protein [Dehalococcoidia bacterium]